MAVPDRTSAGEYRDALGPRARLCASGRAERSQSGVRTGPGHGARPSRSQAGAGAPPPAPMSTILDSLLAAWPDDIAAFRRRAHDVTDWGALLAEAGSEGVAGIIGRALAVMAIPVPGAAWATLDRLRASEELWLDRLERALDDALQALDAARIRAVALKGPVLAERLYPEARARFSADLDLLVAPADLERATAALSALGYAAETGPPGDYHRRHSHHIHLVSPRPPMIELLYLAIHAAGHCFERLLWLYDLKLLLRHDPHLDWVDVARRAHRLRVATAVSLACEMLRRRLGVGIPPAPGLEPSRGSRRLIANLALARLAKHREGARATLGRVLCMATLCDRPASAAWFLQHHLLRMARRRARRWFPRIAPLEWSA